MENEYNLNVIKEIIATSSFLSIERNVRKCQNDESFDECVTRKYIDDLITKCKCLPLNLRLTKKVIIVNVMRYFLSRSLMIRFLFVLLKR